jgi:hypothetical protein
MCAVPHAATNAALHVDIVCKVENSKVFFVKKSPAITSTSILLPAKQARRVNFHDISSGNSNASAASIALIGSAIKPSLHDADDAFSICDISLSA